MPIDPPTLGPAPDRPKVRTAPPPGAPQGDDLLAVIAHSLLSSMSVIVGGTEMLSRHWAELGDVQRSELLATMRNQASHVADVLDNLVRLGDPNLIDALDGLRHDHDDPESASG